MVSVQAYWLPTRPKSVSSPANRALPMLPRSRKDMRYNKASTGINLISILKSSLASRLASKPADSLSRSFSTCACLYFSDPIGSSAIVAASPAEYLGNVCSWFGKAEEVILSRLAGEMTICEKFEQLDGLFIN